MTVQRLEYIGSKFKLLEWIIENIEKRVSLKGKTVGDLFSGTGIVGHHFRKMGCATIANDTELYARIIAHAMTISTYTKRCDDAINALNQELDAGKHEREEGFIATNYSPLKSERMFFTVDNAKRIDYIRMRFKEIKSTLNYDEYMFMLASLLMASDKVSNVTSVYGAYLKQFKKRSLAKLTVVPVHELTSPALEGSATTRKDVLDGIEATMDIVYLDPPYNNRQYSKNYFPLNMIALEDNHPVIKGKTGIPSGCFLSPFSRKADAEGAFETLFGLVDSTWVFLSYNSESIVSKERLMEIMSKFGKVEVEEREYRRFKSASYAEEDKNVVEYLFCLFKE